MSELDGGATEDAGEKNVEFQPWMDSLPDAHKKNESFAQFKEPSDAWNKFDSFLKAEGNTLVIPGEGATDEDRSAFLNKLGRPGTPEEYQLTKPENMPESLQYSEDTEKVFRSVFHEAGLNDTSAQKLWGKYHEMAIEGQKVQDQAVKEAGEKAINDLKDVWVGDKFNQNVEIAHRAFKGLFESPEDQAAATAFLADTKVGNLEIGNHPMFLKLFHRVGSIIGDDRMNFGNDIGKGTGESEEEQARKMFPNTKFD